MPLIQAQEKKVREAVTVKLDKLTVEQLRLYSEFIESTQEYVVNEALLLTFKRDKEFQEWLENKERAPRNGTSS